MTKRPAPRGLVLAALASVVFISGCDSTAGSTPAKQDHAIAAAVAPMTAAQLQDALAKGGVALIDVRTTQEFAEEHIAGAINMPLGSFDPASLSASGREPILYCRSGRRSADAAQLLAAERGETVRHLNGGIVAWKAAGAPVVDPTTP